MPIKHTKHVIGCDLFLNLKLYRIPNIYVEKLEKEFPEVQLIEVNTDSSRNVDFRSINIYWGNRITEDLVHKLVSLQWIHFGCVGVNRAFLPAVKERNILVTNSKGTMTEAVAATALAFMFALARGLHHAWDLRLQDDLRRESFDIYFDEIQDVFAQSCLIVGLGEIGHKLCEICTSLGMTVYTIKKNPVNYPEQIRKVFSLDQLTYAVLEMDYVINLLPLVPDTHQVFDSNVFNSMKGTAFFINVGRGETVVESDLVKAVSEGEIAGAGLDVFSEEPLSSDSPLWNLKNVIITPHIAGVTKHYWFRQCNLFFDNLKRFSKGQDLINVVDIERGY